MAAATKEEIEALALKFQVRCLNIHRKLFFDLQERDVSPEIKDRAAQLMRYTKAGQYPEAKKETDDIAYLFNMLYKVNYLEPVVYKGLEVDARVLSEEFSQIISENEE